MRSLFLALLLVCCLACLAPAQDAPEPAGLDYLLTARQAEAEHDPMAALFLAGKAAGFFHFVDVAESDYPPLLDPSTPDYEEALGIIARNNGFLLWTSPMAAAQHRGEIWSVDFSPDGSRIASGGRWCEVRIWDAAQGTLVWETFVDEPFEQLWDVRFSPDGEYVAAKGLHAVYVWAADDGSLVQTVNATGGFMEYDYEISYSYVAGLSWSSDSARILTGAQGRKTIFDVKTGEVVTAFGHEEDVWYPDGYGILAYSPDGTRIASYDYIEGVVVWSADGLEPVQLLEEFGGLCLAWSPGSDRIAFVAEDIRIVDAQSGELLQTMGQDFWRIVDAAWSPDGRYLAMCGDRPEHEFRVWDLQEGEEIAFLSGVPRGRQVAWSPDGRTVAMGGDGVIGLWDLEQRTLLVPGPGLEGNMGVAGWHPNGQVIATGDDRGFICLWDAASGALLHAMDTGVGVRDLAWDPSGARMVSAGNDYEVDLWDMERMEHRETLYALEQSHGWWWIAPPAVAWSPDGSEIAAMGLEEGILVDVADGTMQLLQWDGPFRGLRNWRWSHSGDRIAAQSYRNMNIMRAADLSQELSFPVPDRPFDELAGCTVYPVMAWSSNDTMIATFGVDQISIWNAADGRALATLDSGYGRSLDWGPESGLITAACASGIETWHGPGFAKWNTFAHVPRRELPHGHYWGGAAVAEWSPDATRLASAGTSLNVWGTTSRQGKYNADILRCVEFDGTELRFIRPLGDIGEVLAVSRQ